MSREQTAPAASGPRFELADVIDQFGAAYERTHRLSRQQRKVLRAIARCRTAALGGHVDACDACGHRQISYNSCRDRHCPKCQGRARVQWVASRLDELLPIAYFHVVFTLPHELYELYHANQRLMLNLLFSAASDTLREFGQRRLGGELGVTAVLHTWGQTLSEHVHLHCIVTGGALTKDGRWVASRPGYLFPVRALSEVYRGKYCAGLQRAQRRGEVVGGDGLEMVESEAAFGRWLSRIRRQAWVVYAKAPFGGPEQVIKYVGRYTHRVAITNGRIVGIEGGRVGFEYKDYRAGGQRKEMWLGGEAFLGRFLRHVLPKGFQRIRHYGLLAKGQGAKLRRCREALEGAVRTAAEPEARHASRTDAVVTDERVCPVCGVGRMQRREELPRMCGPPGRPRRVA
jgi:hypothetical protein